ncbi:hypothetical protein PCANC_01387 [Puccinia coronata f. sp. avenae]|uniref:RING-type domain-containing protein n=1 Tax=Puccinia coronata f. sp. avenae TaxID=200324 RepID=A0A2N5SR54_9BASI|nr:hypothetical protein PCASD_22182 [Puccinia coronata f. sp. avenae]PLW50931.1 hypothetical protein PCASD_01129 [Puccinia coronata f. sp. avenae]PLW57750.1 hypothetical protein PCANC_01387 [Puccinia coronata f. sp. avenae]
MFSMKKPLRESASTKRTMPEPADGSPGARRYIKRSSSTEEASPESSRIPNAKKRSHEPEDEEKRTNRARISDPKSPGPMPSASATKDIEKDEADSLSLANLTCAICLSAPSPAVVTKCGHVTCGECLTASITSQNNSSLGALPAFLHQATGQNRNQITNGKCPVCRAPLLGGWGTAMRGVILKMGKAS